MPEFVRLPLKTGAGRPLPHKFFRQAAEPAGLLLLFPGNLYGVDGPLLFYPSVILGGQGWDTLAVGYEFQVTGGGIGGQGLQDILDDCRLAVLTALQGRRYSRVGLVGKSLGAGVVAHLCANVPDLVEARAAYLTPMIGTPLFDPAFVRTVQPAYLALGTADAFYEAQALETLQAGHPFALTVIEGGDHSLVVAGDWEASIEALRRVTREVVTFLTKPV
jgi:hypothetical protein